MHISLDGFVAGLNGEMDWIKANEEIFDCVGKRIRRHCIIWAGNLSDDGKLLAYCRRQADCDQA